MVDALSLDPVAVTEVVFAWEGWAPLAGWRPRRGSIELVDGRTVLTVVMSPPGSATEHEVTLEIDERTGAPLDPDGAAAARIRDLAARAREP